MEKEKNVIPDSDESDDESYQINPSKKPLTVYLYNKA